MAFLYSSWAKFSAIASENSAAFLALVNCDAPKS